MRVNGGGGGGTRFLYFDPLLLVATSVPLCVCKCVGDGGRVSIHPILYSWLLPLSACVCGLNVCVGAREEIPNFLFSWSYPILNSFLSFAFCHWNILCNITHLFSPFLLFSQMQCFLLYPPYSPTRARPCVLLSTNLITSY